MIAFKMKIFDPKEFSLFAYVDGKEHALDDSFHLADFIDSTFDFQGSQQTLPGRSATSTMNSVRELPNQPTTQILKPAHSYSASSRSGSPTSSSNDSQGQVKRIVRRGSRLGHNTTPWWVLCKKGPGNTVVGPFSSGRVSGVAGGAQTGLGGSSETEMVGPAPNAIDVINSPPLGTGRPLLIFRRASGYFAISDRLLQCLGE
ncbi:unnamed protein product [Echinostoma caproni]|uniref:IRS-type PTB domain-containing protein n=1 Tax=Echinostoma caproni TaxID=27848 RepID=A0A183A578_9TREM|nr:unnamed protein product [Echinostoma caproni]